MAWVVGGVGFAIGIVIVLRLLIPAGMDATIFLALGERSDVQTGYARAALGDVSTRIDQGHDGKYFFIQANDPLLLDPGSNAAFLDRPVYRAQRMLYPLIAGGFGAFPPGVIVWSMLITNVLALGIGTWIAARIAMMWEASPWLGLAVPLNIGLLFELWIDGSGILAYVLCLGAVYALAMRAEWTAAVLLAGAALSREVMVAFALGIVVLALIERRRVPRKLILVPLAAIVIWNGYLQLRLMDVPGTGEPWPFFGPPFVGMFQAFRFWTRDASDLVLNIAILLLVAAFVGKALKDRSTIVWGALPFVALATLLSIYVWREPFDISRTLAPVFTAAPFALLVPMEQSRFTLEEDRR